MDKPKIRCLVQDGQREDTKLLLLSDKLTDVTGLSEDLQSFVSSEKLEHCTYQLKLGYESLTANQVLKVSYK